MKLVFTFDYNSLHFVIVVLKFNSIWAKAEWFNNEGYPFQLIE